MVPVPVMTMVMPMMVSMAMTTMSVTTMVTMSVATMSVTMPTSSVSGATSDAQCNNSGNNEK
jgi:hypothetical protein